MRTIGYATVIAILLLVTALAGRWVWQGMDRGQLSAYLSGQLEGAKPSNTFISRGDHWLEFQLDGNGSSIHVVSNASVSREQVIDNDLDWTYSFDYQLLDSDGRLLREGEYYHRTHITRYRDSEHGNIVTKNFLLNALQLPTDSRKMVVPIARDQRPVQLRLRVHHTDPALLNILFRVYEKEVLAVQKLEYRWQRFSESSKQVLARGSVYGPEHLRFSEQQNLLRSRWRPLGPGGVIGGDYRLRKLYIKQVVPGEVVDDPVLPEGLYVDTDTRGIIPLPEGGGNIRLQWAAVEESAGAVKGGLELRWYGRSLGDRSQTRVPLTDRGGGLEAHFGEGMLELISPVPLVVHAFWQDTPGSVDITPQGMRLRVYAAPQSMPLVYQLDHVDNQLTSLRVDVRKLLTADNGQQPPVDFEILDATGARLAAGELHQDLTPSVYDRLSTIEPDVRLSEAARNYFKLPTKAAKLRIWNNGSALVNAYTRPGNLARELRYPEDLVQARLDEQGEMGQPAWFVLQPANSRAMLEHLQTQMLLLQNHPPEDDPRLLAGKFAWEEYQPDGDWRGRHLLLPRDGTLPVRDLSRGAIYRELPMGREVSAVLRSVEGLRELRPTLIYQREGHEPMTVTVLRDGVPWYDTRVRGRTGQLLLPVTATGHYQIEVRGSETARWFMNYMDSSGPSYVRRLAYRVERGGLEFRYHKRTNEAEVLTGQLYQVASERLRLDIDIEYKPQVQLQPLVDSTYLHRIYDLRTVGTSRVMVLNADTETVDGGRRFFVPLGTDLPPGDYHIRIQPEQDTPAYLALYRLLPGQQVERAFLRERGNVE